MRNMKWLLLVGLLLVGCGDNIVEPQELKLLNIEEFCKDKDSGVYGSYFESPIKIYLIQETTEKDDKIMINNTDFSFSEDSLFVNCNPNDSVIYWVIHQY